MKEKKNACTGCAAAEADRRFVRYPESADGEAVVTAYPVFPGIEIAYCDIHAHECRLEHTPGISLMRISHCREGRLEQQLGNEYYFLAPGDLAVSRSDASDEAARFPTGHYHGITVTIDPAQAPECLSCLLSDVNVRPAALMEKFCANGGYFAARSSASVEHIFSELYSVPEEIRKGYFKVKVLELLLYYAIPRRDTNELAHTLLDRFGSLERVLLAPREELMKVPGVGEGAALLLTLVPAVSQYTHRHAPQETILNSVDASGRYFMRLLRHERRELLYQACLDGKGKLLSCRCLSEGGVNMAAVTLRQIVEHALLSGASSVLLAHNHPSGIALPSASDRQMTLQVRDALATMGIRLTDHIIVADDDFVSMAQSGLLQ